MNNYCNDCKFVFSHGKQLFCRRHAPSPIATGTDWDWPTVSRWDACGEFKPKLQLENYPEAPEPKVWRERQLAAPRINED